MRGHVYRRGSTWTYVVDKGVQPDGTRRQTSKGGLPHSEGGRGGTRADDHTPAGRYVRRPEATDCWFVSGHPLAACRPNRCPAPDVQLV
jgi:hypothetical protein